MNKKEWRAEALKRYNVTEEACLEERSDYEEKSWYGQRCIEDELLGRALLKEFAYYETTFNAEASYISDLEIQYKGIDSIVNLGSRSVTIDEKCCIGDDNYNRYITLEIMQRDRYGKWHTTQSGKMTNEFLYINVCLDTNKLFVVRLSYPKMMLMANKYASIMPESVKDLTPYSTDGVFHMTGSGEGIYILVPFSEAISVAEYDLGENK